MSNPPTKPPTARDLLWSHMRNEHDVTLLESELDEIIRLAQRVGETTLSRCLVSGCPHPGEQASLCAEHGEEMRRREREIGASRETPANQVPVNAELVGGETEHGCGRARPCLATAADKCHNGDYMTVCGCSCHRRVGGTPASKAMPAFHVASQYGNVMVHLADMKQPQTKRAWPEKHVETRASGGCVWFVVGPDDVRRRVFMSEPDETALAWAASADGLTRSVHCIETPGDLFLAVEAGYRIERIELAGEPNGCLWTYDIDGFWQTCCGEAFAFGDGGPPENKFEFCYRCGKRIGLAPTKDAPTQ